MEFHEVANLFPMMTPDEFAGLKEDIDRNGQIDPVWIHDGKIIDGRNRYLACTELGIEPLTREWNGNGDLVDFVVSMNVIRRHLSAGQKAFIALSLEDLYADRARNRQGSRTDIKENLPECSKGQSRDQAGAVLGVSGRYVSIAKRIRNNAPELQPLVQGNDLSMKLADRLAAYNHPPYRQAVLQVHDLWKDSDKSLAQIESLLFMVFHWYNPDHFSDQWFIHHFSAPQHWFWVNPFSLMELLNCEGPHGEVNPKCRVCNPEYRKKIFLDFEESIPTPACTSKNDSPPEILPWMEFGPWGRKPDWNMKIHWLTAYHKIKDRGFEGVEFEEPGELVKSRQQWEKAGRRVKRGEKGIRLVFKHVGPGESYEPTMNPFTGFVRYEAHGFHVSQTDKAA